MTPAHQPAPHGAPCHAARLGATAGAAATALAVATPPAAMAAEPYCNVQETCSQTSDNCQPAEGLLKVDVLPSGKASVRLTDRPALESTILEMGGQIILLFTDGTDEHELRIAGDGKFNYLISTADRDAPKGKDQVLYRGQCVEG